MPAVKGTVFTCLEMLFRISCTGLNAALVRGVLLCSVEALRPLSGVGPRAAHSFSSHTQTGASRGTSVRPALYSTAEAGALTPARASTSQVILFTFPDVWNPSCFAVILHPGQTHFSVGSGPPFIMESR